MIGLSKINRSCFFAQRPVVQERLTQQVLVALQTLLGTEDVAVTMTAVHYCVKARGVKDGNSTTRTTSPGGVFKTDLASRAEFLCQTLRPNLESRDERTATTKVSSRLASQGSSVLPRYPLQVTPREVCEPRIQALKADHWAHCAEKVSTGVSTVPGWATSFARRLSRFNSIDVCATTY